MLLGGQGHTPFWKTQWFCTVRASPPLENTMTLCSESHLPLGKTQRLRVVRATCPFEKHNDSAWWEPHTFLIGKPQWLCVVRDAHRLEKHNDIVRWEPHTTWGKHNYSLWPQPHTLAGKPNASYVFVCGRSTTALHLRKRNYSVWSKRITPWERHPNPLWRGPRNPLENTRTLYGEIRTPLWKTQ